MGKIKNTKNELKAQRDALKRFKRYLPTLLLKKQQLQMEVRQLEAKIEAKKAEEQQARQGLSSWIKLYSEPIDLSQWLSMAKIERSSGNIAGVNIPVLKGIVFRRETPDLHTTPAWVDDGLKTLEQLVLLRIERRVLDEQLRLLADELRTTSQRVNLFEKVKIPECTENIRVIRIFMGDMDTAGVARSKIAKSKSMQKVVAA